MRIVGGRLRGRPIVAPAGAATRPTSDRLRGTIFDIRAHRFGQPEEGVRVLDLFAGSGALGLEALSRGAGYALFVDNAASARGAIRANIDTLELAGATRLFRRDATRLGPAGNIAHFGLAFADPPYGRSLGEASLAAAAAGGWLAPGALVVLEEAARPDIGSVAGLTLLDRRAVGSSALHIFNA